MNPINRASSLFGNWTPLIRGGLLLAFLTPLLVVAEPKKPSPADQAVDFNRDIRPILSDQCFKCHGPDDKTRKAKLRLDIGEEAMKQLEGGGAAIVPRNSAASKLIQRITTTDPEELMPPAKSGKTLKPGQAELLRRWIDQGAAYRDHWAYNKIEKPALPAVRNQRWPRNEIDRFVLARLESEKLAPTEEAEKRTLLRRVYLDLAGVPPSVEEVKSFLADKSGAAYEKVVDRLLNSPLRGEHMARFWLDSARYADSNGYQYDTERTMWRWRDWVIGAFNANMPFDQFTIEQLAGDLLPGATTEQKLATGFNRNHPITIEGGVIDEEYRTEYVIDRLTTTSTVWLGLTMGCARCHDHKYDPFTQTDFYRLFAFFNQVPEKGNSGFSPMIKTPSPRQVEDLEAVAREIKAKEKAFGAAMKAAGSSMEEWEKSLKGKSAPVWKVLEPSSAKSSGGSTMSILEDKSVLAGGTNPGHDVYEILAPAAGERIVAVRLEALTHDSLPNKGPGRYDNSNFVLSEFELEVSGATPEKFEKVAFASATADYSQKDYEIAKAIDGKVEAGNGWAVDGPTRRQNATATFVLKAPLTVAKGAELRFRLRHESLNSHGIGRARLSLTGDDLTAVPAPILAILNKETGTRTENEAGQLRDYYAQNVAPAGVRDLFKSLAESREKRKALDAALPSTMVMQDMEQKRETFMLVRGQYDKHGAKVTAGVPAKFADVTSEPAENRLDFARWLVDPSNPLTARVAVNRFWQQIFGVGIVKTVEDFGVQGEFPSHPEMLDWLAKDFMDNGWNIRRLQKLIVTSATYRQHAKASAALIERDPENRLLARGPRARLAAEVIRDSALVASGLAQEEIGGPSVYPYQPPGLWNELNDRAGYSREYAADKGSKLYRRSVYSYWKRTVPPPTMQLFDAPEREFCVARRSSTTTPLQSLALLNDPQFVEAARKLGERMMREGGGTFRGRLDLGFMAALGRTPTTPEARILQTVYEESLRDFKKDGESAAKALRVGDSEVDSALDRAELAAISQVARALLNLDEFICKN